MTYGEAEAFLCSTAWKGSRLGLSRVAALLAALGDPQKGLRTVHVAGTNGKGSVCALTASVLTAAGYRTGLFTSPCLRRVNEQLRVDGNDVSDGDFAALAAEVKPFAERIEDRPTQFELLTAMALLYFRERACGAAVLEVGLGGALDATNVIPAPEAAVICSIGLDHTAVLGGTLGEIAAQKAGIVKPGASVVLCAQSREAEEAVRARCRECGCALRVTEPAALRPVSAALSGQTFDYRTRTGLFIPLAGTYQLENAAVALDALDALRDRGWRIPEDAVRGGLARAEWPARFETLRREPPFLLDGAHNPAGAAQLAACLRRYLPGQKLVFLMGVMADKDVRGILRIMAPLAERFVAVTPDNPRAMPSPELAALIRSEFSLPAEDAGRAERGAALVLERYPEKPACAFGSLYQAGGIREFFGKYD